MTAKPRRMDQYLGNGERLVAAVNAYRAAKGAASVTQEAERSACNVTSSTPSKGEASAEGAPVTQHERSFVECNKPKSYRLPPLDTPTPIPGYPLNNPSPAHEVPDYVTIGRVKATRATQAARRGKRAPLTPSGPSRLVKRRV